MKVFVWRHNRKYHSYSMMSEPCVHQDLYADAVAVVLAQDQKEALDLLAERDGWRTEEMALLEPKIYELEKAQVLFANISG